MLRNLLRLTAWTVGLSALTLGAEAATPQACRWYVTARAGDTCNSIAAEWGITYAQFIRNNPTITSCYLTAGTRYCVDDRDALLPTTSTVPRPTTSTLVPPISPSGTRSSTAATPTPSVSGFTRDGRCGPQGGSQTCVGSEYGDCCSAEGWCGATNEHCGVGCILGYGLCGIGPVSSGTSNTTTGSITATGGTTQTSAPIPTAQTTITITAVSSTVLTFFSLVPQTQTTNVTLTETSLATSTAVITRTQVETTTSTAVFTRTQVETTTLIVAQTSGCAVTVTVTATAAGVSSTGSSTDSSAAATNPIHTTVASTESSSSSTPTSSFASSAPSPTQPGTTSSCKRASGDGTSAPCPN